MRCTLFLFLLVSLAFFWVGQTRAEEEHLSSISESVRVLSEQISQQRPSQRDDLNQMQPEAAQDIYYQANINYRMAQEKNRILLLLVIVASTPILLLIVLTCMHKKPGCSGENIVNAVGLILVVEGTMFVAVSAPTSEQLTAPIGILGAIAGYLFGSTQQRKSTKSSEEQSA